MVSFLRFQISVHWMNKMDSATVETICFQDEIPVTLNTKVIMFARKYGIQRWGKSSMY